MKIAKLSLVAAVAVAGFTTANAQPLEEAIKNVDVSGSVVYRYNDYKNNALDVQNGVNTPKTAVNNSDTNNNYKVGLNLSSKVNEDVKFNSRFLVSNVAKADGGFAKLNNSDSGDTNAEVELSHANFGYTGIKNTTVTVGKQGLTTPWTVALDSDGNEQTGTGILALSTIQNVTLAGAYFNQSNINTSGDVLVGDGSEAIGTVGAIAVLGPVTVDAWYLDLEEEFDSYTIGAKVASEMSGIKLGADARYTSLTLQDDKNPATKEDNSLAKIVLTADAGLVDGKLAYATTDKDGGLAALDIDSATNLLGWNLFANNKADADYYQAVLGFDILSNLNLSANYGNVEYKSSNAANADTVEQQEVYAQLLYKMSKNLSTYVRYGTLTEEQTTTAGVSTDNLDSTIGRLQVEYTF